MHEYVCPEIWRRNVVPFSGTVVENVYTLRAYRVFCTNIFPANSFLRSQKKLLANKKSTFRTILCLKLLELSSSSSEQSKNSHREPSHQPLRAERNKYSECSL